MVCLRRLFFSHCPTKSVANLAGHSADGAKFVRELFQVVQRNLAGKVMSWAFVGGSWVVGKLTEVRTPTTPSTRTRRPPSRVPFGRSSTACVRAFPAFRVARALRFSSGFRLFEVARLCCFGFFVLEHPAQAAAATLVQRFRPFHVVRGFVAFLVLLALLLGTTTTIAVTRRH